MMCVCICMENSSITRILELAVYLCIFYFNCVNKNEKETSGQTPNKPEWICFHIDVGN